MQLVCETPQVATDILEALRDKKLEFEGTAIRARRDRTTSQRLAGVAFGDLFSSVRKALEVYDHLKSNKLLADPVRGCLWISSGDRARKLFDVEVLQGGGIKVSPQADALALLGLMDKVAAMAASAQEAARPRL